MALFSSNKDKEEKAQTEEIKQASAPSASPEPDFKNPFESNVSPPDSPISNGPPQIPHGETNGIPPPTHEGVDSQEDLFSQVTSPSTQMSDSMSREEIQEMIDETLEKIIDEKWDRVVSNVEKVVTWKDTMEKQVNMLKEDIVKFREAFEELESKLTGKLNNYDRDILDVNSEMKALEKVFQKITPTLVNNVNELSKIANDLRESKEEAKESLKK